MKRLDDTYLLGQHAWCFPMNPFFPRVSKHNVATYHVKFINKTIPYLAFNTVSMHHPASQLSYQFQRIYSILSD